MEPAPPIATQEAEEARQERVQRLSPPIRSATAMAWEQRARAKDWNALLPYAAELEREREEHLEDVRRGLAWSAGVLDMSGVGFYARSVDLVMDLKHAIPPDDAVRIAQLLWGLVCLPGSALTVAQRAKFGAHLNDLLYKKRLLRSADGAPLQLPWRPALSLLRECNDASPATPEFVGSRDLSLHGRELGMLLRKARAYFPEEAVREIWDELSPQVAPDDAHGSALAILCAMLPTQHAGSHTVWFDEAAALWQSVRGKTDWDTSFLYLFARLAKHQQGRVDFSPLLPFLLDKTVRLLRLPTGGRPSGVSQTSAGGLSRSVRSGKDPYHHIGVILAYCLGGSHPQAQPLCAELMRVCTKYMHPSNVGAHSMTISQLLLGLVGCVSNRIDHERNGRSEAPESCHLTDADVEEFIAIVSPLTFLGVFSPHPVMGWCSQSITRKLAALSPTPVLLPVLERMVPLMEEGNPHPQTLFAAMEVAALTMPSILDLQRFPAGRSFVPKLLLGTVDGLDISEKLRTRATLKVYCALLSCAYLAPLSADAAYVAEEHDAAISEALEPWAEEFVPRALTLLDHGTKPDKHNAGDGELLITTMRLFFAHISPALYDSALAKVARFVETNLFHNALTPVGRFVEECVHASPAKALDLLVPITASKLSADSGCSEEEELCMLRVLSKAVKRAGAAIVPHKDYIGELLARYICKEKHDVCKEAAKLFRCTMHGLVATYAGAGCLAPSASDGPPSDYSSWASYTDATETTIDWHVPSEEELDVARELLREFVGQAIRDLGRISEEPESFDKEGRWRVLKQIQNSLRAWVCGWGESDDGGDSYASYGSYALGEEVVHTAGGNNRQADGFPPMTRRPIAAGRSPLIQDVAELHQSMGQALHSCAVYVAGNLSAELDTLKVLCKAIGVWLVGSALKGEDLKRHSRRALDAMKTVATNPLNSSQRSRAWIIQRAESQHLFRVLSHQPTKTFTPLCEQLMEDLSGFVLHPFSTVRKRAQLSLESSLRRFPYRKVGFIRKMAEVLQKGKEHPREEIKGAAYLLKSPHLMSRACKDYGLLLEIVRAVCAQLGHEKPSVSTQIDMIFASMLSRVSFEPLTSSTLTVPVPEEWLQYIPPEAAATAEETHHARAERRQERYGELVSALEELGGAPDVHWKQSLVVQACITFCAHVAGTLPSAGSCALLTNRLFGGDYLGRRLGVISASVVAAMNRDLVGVESSPVADVVSVAEAFASEPPTTAEAWQSTVFVDSFEYGFRGSAPAGCIEHQTAESGQGVGDQLADVGLGMLLSAESLERILSHMVADHREEAEGRGSAGDVALTSEAFIGALYRKQQAVGAGFASAHARMWQSFFRLGGLELFQRIAPLLTPLLDADSSGSHRARQATVAEVVAGVARGSKHWPFADLDKLWAEHLLPIWLTVVNNASSETLTDWEMALGFLIRRRDPRRVHWLAHWLEAYDLNADTDTKQCVAVLRLVSCVLRTYGWRMARLAESQMSKLQGMLAHPFKQVRVEVGRLLAVAMSAAPSCAACSALLVETTRLCTPVTPADDEMAVVGDDGEGADDAAARATTNARDTMLWMSSLHVARSACYTGETTPQLAHAPTTLTSVDVRSCGRDASAASAAAAGPRSARRRG